MNASRSVSFYLDGVGESKWPVGGYPRPGDAGPKGKRPAVSGAISAVNQLHLKSTKPGLGSRHRQRLSANVLDSFPARSSKETKMPTADNVHASKACGSGESYAASSFRRRSSEAARARIQNGTEFGGHALSSSSVGLYRASSVSDAAL